jgi:hypothetical protein
LVIGEFEKAKGKTYRWKKAIGKWQQLAISKWPEHLLGISQAKCFRLLIEDTPGTPPEFGKWVILKSSNWQLAISQSKTLLLVSR